MARDKRSSRKGVQAQRSRAAVAERTSSEKARLPRTRAGSKHRASVLKITKGLEQALERQAASAAILKIIASSRLETQPIFDTIAASANQLMGGYSTTLWRYVDGLLHLAAYTPVNPTADEKLRSLRPFPPTLVYEKPILEGTPVQIFDTEESESASPTGLKELGRARGFRSLLVVPLISGGSAIGTINVSRARESTFAEADVELLRTFADQAVIAIENSRLFNETREALERQTATADVLKVIASSPSNLQPVFDAIAKRSNELMHCHSTTVFRFIGNTVELAAFTPVNEEADTVLRAAFPRQLSTIAGFDSVLRGDVVETIDAASDTEPQMSRAIARARGFRSRLIVPLKSDSGIIGAISITRKEPGAFAEKDKELLRTFADQAVIAVQNVRLFEEVQARTRELTKSLEELRTTQDRLVQTQKLALLGQLTAGIAHEIKNPLNFVNNFSGISAELIDELRDALKGVSLDDKARAEIEELTNTLKGNFDKVVHHCRRADAIVKNMLQHSREGSGEHRVIDINALVEESLNLAWHGARAETQGFEVKLKQSFDPTAGGADVFPQDIRRALLNLIANGFYATKRKAEANDGDYEPTLTASTKSLGDHVEIRIRDNGTGITPNVKEKIFEPFFTTKPTGEGTGLGLSISHDIVVKQHAGTIEVETQPGAFTEIRIVLPRTPAFV